MLTSLLKRLETVTMATTGDEREAIYRFRYGVYVEELRRSIGGVDHARRFVCDDEDEAATAVHLYAGPVNDIKGVVRLRIWEPGQVPEDDRQALSLDLFANIERYRTCEVGRFMIHPKVRGKLILPAMAYAAYDLLIGRRMVDLAFCYCRPGLVGYYRKLGARPYGGRLVDAPEGMEVPLVGVVSDRAYYKKMGSPLLPMVKKYFGPGKRTLVDATPFQHLFDEGAQRIETNVDKVWAEIQDHLMFNDEQRKGFLERLPERVQKQLAKNGFIMDVPAGGLLTRQGHAEREMFFVLSGSLEVYLDDRRLGLMGPGDLFGEVAFFRESGVRTASVKALNNARVLSIRRKFVDDVGRDDPEAARTILFHLGAVLAERLAMSEARARTSSYA